MERVNVAIVGAGNVGWSVLKALFESQGLEGQDLDQSIILNPSVILTRRPKPIEEQTRWLGYDIPVRHLDDYQNLGGIPVDVAILCGGSKEDLWEQGPIIAKWRPTVDSFDTHGLIPKYLKLMDESARKGGNVSIISIGWDPGLFSLIKLWGKSFFNLKVYTFYGLTKEGGLSMGHSNAIRDGVPGVLAARSYTHAIPEAIERVLFGENPVLTPGEMHWRENFVVAEEGADRKRITHDIQTMKDYFLGYRTEVKFITQEEMDRDHCRMFHNGMAIAVGETFPGNKVVMKFECHFGSNPEATARILIAHARTAVRMSRRGKVGAFTINGVLPDLLSPYSEVENLVKFM